jgi:hypothetical protein
MRWTGRDGQVCACAPAAQASASAKTIFLILEENLSGAC